MSSRKLSREDLLGMVEKLLTAEGTEEELDELLRRVEANVPHPRVSDLIYYPEVELTAEEIVDMALGYKAITLPESLEPVDEDDE